MSMKKAIYRKFVLVILLALGLCTAIFYLIAGNILLDNTRKDLLYSLQMVDAMLDYDGDLKEQFSRMDALSHAQAAGLELLGGDSRRLTILTTGGEVCVDTDVDDTAVMDNHLAREEIRDALNIVCTGQKQLVGELSGGNQQKVVIGRWMTGDFKVFIFDQPTTGVDIGAKTEIYKQMVALAKKGCGIIFISSENEELMGICDRIAVMTKGRIVKEFDAGNVTEHDILYWSAGGEEEEKKEAGNVGQEE